MNNLNLLKTGNKFNLDAWQNHPCYIAVKNKKGKYLDANDYLAHAAGFRKANDLIGCTDFDMWGNEAESIKNNDIKILTNLKPLVFLESVTLKDESKMTALSQKAPLLSRTNKIIGLTVVSIIISINESNHLNERLQLSQQKPSFDSKDMHGVTKRQFECLVFLVQGMTMKEIGKKLSLSPKTVEHYIEAMKITLQCNSRIELIKKALQLWHFE